MTNTEKILDNIYKIQIPLPHTPLKSLNAYLIRGERNLLIDTGFNEPGCYAALTAGLEELGAKPEETDIFLTHLHSDHAGLAFRLQRSGTRVYISAPDAAILDVNTVGAHWKRVDAVFLSEGFPAEKLEKLPFENVAQTYAPAKNCVFTFVRAGDMLSYGGHQLQVLDAAGHTPAQLCLYIEAAGVLFLADHILFDITPNIQIWSGMEDALGTYLDSLRQYRHYSVTTPLPGHRGVSMTMDERIGQILHHHDQRLEELRSVLSGGRALTAYEIAGQMTWSIRAKSWDDFPLSQQWFATGEVLAHLRYLQKRGQAACFAENGIYRYTI